MAASLLTLRGPTDREPPEFRCPRYACTTVPSGTRSNTHAFNSFGKLAPPSVNKLAATVQERDRGGLGYDPASSLRPQNKGRITLRNLSVLMAIPVLLLAVSGARGQSPAHPAATAPAKKDLPSFDLVEHAAFPLERHLESKNLAAGTMKLQDIYEDGAKLFHRPYNGLDGVGVRRLPNGTPANRFTPFPVGGGMLTSFSSQACGSCHTFPYAASAGLAHTDLAFDPGADGQPPYNIRSTTSLFGDGLLQLLAQEITEQLQSQRDIATESARKSPGKKVGLDLSGLEGVDPDDVTALVVYTASQETPQPAARLKDDRAALVTFLRSLLTFSPED